MKRAKGFTLIEIMIVVSIIAILVGIALPSYLNSIQRSRRTDAKEALTRIAALQERYFFTNNNYAPTLALLGASNTTQNGYYTLDFVVANATQFTLTATPAVGSSQARDLACIQFSINQVGQKTANKAGPVNTTVECWQ